VVIARGANGRVDIRSRMPGDYFYRIRRIIGSRTSDWSAGVAVRIASPAGWVALDSGSDASLIDVQCALVRLCAALGDRMALLSLPDHFDESEAVAHASVLRARLEPLAHSYGAVWHPWLTSRDPRSGELLSSPPEGATAGVMAARALARGAWIAPANEPIQGVIALDPTLPRAALQALQDAAVNVIRQEPSGFICLDADTLSGDDDVRPVNVRRLLILLRRAALGTGNRYVFEPNGERLRRAVKRGFEAMLEQMFARGAFAGRRAKDAFRVTTDTSVNPPQGVEAGRFLAEIRVAPSRPLSFLTLRLLQRGGGTVVQEVR
jgi:phage tail sheath protein FI